MFPTVRGMRLGWVYFAYMAISQELGFEPTADERTYILLAALDMVPSGVKASSVLIPEHAQADCYNAAAASLDAADAFAVRQRAESRVMFAYVKRLTEAHNALVAVLANRGGITANQAAQLMQDVPTMAEVKERVAAMIESDGD